MNLKERQEFWNVLCDCDGKDIESAVQNFSKVIKYPKYLYRYREVTPNSLEALRTNHLFFSTANYYDDPFDTFLQINTEKLLTIANEALNNPEEIRKFTEFLKISGNVSLFNLLGFKDDEEITQEKVKELFNIKITNNFIKNICDFRNELKKDIWSVCFSENPYNEVLWLKYAKQHKGFVLVYDLTDGNKLMCGKKEKCTQCAINKNGTMLYPVYYSNKKYDATDYARDYTLKIIEEQYPQIDWSNIFPRVFENPIFEILKITLIKKESHKYDEEWRMIIPYKIKPPVMREWIPSGVILGLRMDINEENLVVSLAKQAGIEHFYKSYINLNGDLDYKEIFI